MHARPAGQPPGPQPFRRDLLSERGREREPVQVDSDGRLAQLRLVAAADPGGKLQHSRPVPSDRDQRGARPLSDPERFRGAFR